jgi:LysM repeat protein
MTTNCNKFYLVQPNDSCYDIAATSNIALPDFYSWNPALNGDCSGLYPDYYVCVGLVSSSMTTTTTTTTTGTGGAVVTPTPTQAGMVSDCTKFYLVQSGDGCYDIASAEGVALSDLYAWNPALNGDCSGLWPDYYICVGRGDATATTTTTTTTTTVITTPTPTQTGMISGCKTFHLVQSGDGCYDIATKYGITLDQFYQYNPAVGNDCSGLWPDYYVCVGV